MKKINLSQRKGFKRNKILQSYGQYHIWTVNLVAKKAKLEATAHLSIEVCTISRTKGTTNNGTNNKLEEHVMRMPL